MSLIRTWRERQEGPGGPRKPPALWKLLAGLILVIIVFWYLSTLT